MAGESVAGPGSQQGCSSGPEHTLAQHSPQFGHLQNCPPHVPSPELPRPGQAGFPANGGREWQTAPVREGRLEETFWKVPWRHLSLGDALVRRGCLGSLCPARQHPQNTLSSRKKPSAHRVLGGFAGLLKLEGSGGADQDEKVRRITGAAGFGLCNTGNPELGTSCISFASL